MADKSLFLHSNPQRCLKSFHAKRIRHGQKGNQKQKWVPQALVL